MERPNQEWERLKREGLRAECAFLMRTQIPGNMHVISESDLLQRLGSSKQQGLSSYRAQELLEINGGNTRNPKKMNELWVDWMISSALLALIFTVSFSAAIFAIAMKDYEVINAKTGNIDMHSPRPYGKLALCSFLILLVVHTFVFEWKWDRRYGYTNEEWSSHLITVLRDGDVKMARCKDLVVGDIVELKTGDAVPADIRIISGDKLIIDNFWLHKNCFHYLPNHEASQERNLFLAGNMVWAGSKVREGTARGVVVWNGRNTIAGRLIQLIACDSAADSEMKDIADQLLRFSNVTRKEETSEQTAPNIQ